MNLAETYGKIRKPSHTNYKTRNFVENPEAKRQIADWVRKHVG